MTRTIIELFQIQTEQLCNRAILYWNGAVWTYRLDDGEAYSTRESAQAVLTALCKRGVASPLAYVGTFKALEVVPPTTTLCYWCDEPAIGEPVRYAGTNHPACPVHSAEYC